MGAGSLGSGVWRDPAVAQLSGVMTVGIDAYYRLPGLQRWALWHARDPLCAFGPDADLVNSPHDTYLRPDLRFIRSAGSPPSSQTELQVAVATLRGFIAAARKR